MERRCPDCAAPLPESVPAAPACPACGLPLVGPAAAELWQVDQQLAWLTGRRRVLLSVLRAGGGVQAQVGASEQPPATAPVPPRRPVDASRLGVRNVLLILGGLLLGIAAIAFTVISWSELGMGARALILLTLTGIALGAAWPLTRRGLEATAETLAGVGLLLIFLQAYAAYAYDLFGITSLGARWYTAVAVTATTMIWGAYGAVAPLRLPRSVAVVLAQLPVPLAAWAMDASPEGMALALIGVSALDLLVLREPQNERGGRAAPVRVVATAAGLAVGLLGAVIVLLYSFDPAAPGPRCAAVLLLASVVALGWAVQRHSAVGLMAGLTLAAGLAAPQTFTADWEPAAYAGASALVLAGLWLLTGPWATGRRDARARADAEPGVVTGTEPDTETGVVTGAGASARPETEPGEDTAGKDGAAEDAPGLAAVRGVAARLLPGRVTRLARRVHVAAGRVDADRPVPLRETIALGAALPWVGAALWVLPGALLFTVGQVARLGEVWAGSPERLQETLGSDVLTATPVVLALVGALLVTARRRALAAPALALAAVTLPPAVGLPYGVSLVVMVATSAALACWAGLDRSARTSAGFTAVAVTVVAALAALSTEPATLAVLGASTLAAVTLAVVAPSLRAGAATMAVLTLAGFVAAAGLSSGRPAHVTAFGVLAVSALAASAAVRVRHVAVECAGWLVAAVAVVMTVEREPLFSTALALTGVIALGVALRADRRRAVWAGYSLLVAALWTRLGDIGVTAPEAYTAPVSAAALVVGLLRRRAVPASSSWRVFGPALAATMVPSLIATWAGSGWIRPLLLGAAALGVAYAGAHYRQQAPLLLGGAVAFLDAARQLAPGVAAVVERVPGWVPIALAGLVTLLLGATYEQRLRDLRRLRDAVSRLG